MYAAQLLDEAKTRLCLKSDYALAKASGITPGQLAEMRYGKRAIPLHLAYWLAITLERDPAQVVAILEEEREKNPARRDFWKSFISHAAPLTLTVCMLAFALFGLGGTVQAASGGNRTSADNPYYVK